MSKRQQKRIDLFNEVMDTFARIESSLSMLRHRYVNPIDEQYPEDIEQAEEEFNDLSCVVNTVWRLCSDIMRAVKIYACTQTSMKNDTVMMEEVNRRLDEIAEIVQINWLDRINLDEEFSFHPMSPSRDIVVYFAGNWVPETPLHDQPWNLSEITRLVMEHTEQNPIDIHEWRKYIHSL